LRARVAEAGFLAIAPETPFSIESGSGFDLFVAFDVIEHLDLASIRSCLREMRAALKPGGLIVLRIPSGDSPFSSAVFRGDLTHLTLLGSSAVCQLAHEAGLQIRQIREPVLPIRPYRSARILRRLIMRVVRSVVYRFTREILMGNRTAVLSPNMVTVLRRAP